MAKYIYHIDESIAYEIKVEASNEEEAIEKGNDIFNNERDKTKFPNINYGGEMFAEEVE